MKILISAAETSADIHGAALLGALRKQSRIPIEAFGIGGPQLQAEGLNPVVDSRELSVMGFVEILGHLPKVFSSLNKVTKAARDSRPDVAVFIDFPEFHFKLAKRLAQLDIPMIYYIPPKVWAWRKKRVKFLKKYFEQILCIFPFEEEFYKKEGVSAIYVGNPLIDELPLEMTKQAARQKLNLHQNDKVVVLMPGSRKSELQKHLSVMLQAVNQVAEKLDAHKTLKQGEKLHVLMPFPKSVNVDSLSIPEINALISFQIRQGEADICLVAADCGLIKSGTSTLEAGILGCPHAVVYKPSASTGWIFKNLIRYSGPVGLVNLVAGWEKGKPYLVREILCDEVTQENLANELWSLLTHEDRRHQMSVGFAQMRNKLVGALNGQSPSEIAASEVLRFKRDKTP